MATQGQPFPALEVLSTQLFHVGSFRYVNEPIPPEHPVVDFDGRPARSYSPGAGAECLFEPIERCDRFNVTKNVWNSAQCHQDSLIPSTGTLVFSRLRVLTGAGLAVTTLRCIHCSLEAGRRNQCFGVFGDALLQVIDLRGCCLQSISGLQAVN